jgi:hypothetical protein
MMMICAHLRMRGCERRAIGAGDLGLHLPGLFERE